MQEIQSAVLDTADDTGAENKFSADVDHLEDLKRRTQIELPVNFTFRCHDLHFEAVVRDMSGETSVFASAELGSVPFSVEAREARDVITELLACKPEIPTARLVQRNHGKIAVIGSILLGGEPTIPRIFAAVAALAGSMRPLIGLTSAVTPSSPRHRFASATG